jgi:Ca2+/Na+ antiporter
MRREIAHRYGGPGMMTYLNINYGIVCIVLGTIALLIGLNRRKALQPLDADNYWRDLLHAATPPAVKRQYYVWNLSIITGMTALCLLDLSIWLRVVLMLITIGYVVPFVLDATRRILVPPPPEHVADFVRRAGLDGDSQ